MKKEREDFFSVMKEARFKKEVLKKISEELFDNLFGFMKETKTTVAQMSRMLGINRRNIERWRNRNNHLKSLKAAQQLAVKLLAIKANAYDVIFKYEKLMKLKIIDPKKRYADPVDLLFGKQKDNRKKK